jgi:hypothetical protein
MKLSAAVVGGLIVLAALAGCQTQRENKVDLSTPEKTFAVYLQAIESYDETGAEELFSARGKGAATLRDDLVEAIFSTRHFSRVMWAWFPQNRELIVEDLGDEEHVNRLREWLKTVKITVDGDRATVSGETTAQSAAQTGMGFLVRQKEQWRFDLDRVPGIDKYPSETSAAMLHLAAVMGPHLRAVARDVEMGRLKTVSEVKQALAARMK